MPWPEVTTMSARCEFIALANQPDANLSRLCQRFGISRTSAYKWLDRAAQAPASGESLGQALADQSRRPHHSPTRTDPAVEAQVVQLRQQHPAWGGRKIASRLRALGSAPVPAPSTVTSILRRHDLLEPHPARPHQAWQRFEHAAPNDLWQMDFKGDFALTGAGRCYPLTVLDDHARFALCLQACGDQQTQTVQQALTQVFRRYGLPHRITADNGSPWGVPHRSGPDEADTAYTQLGIWLLRLGIRLSHSRPHHPQTQGKDERFHRTFKAEVLAYQQFRNLGEAQRSFDPWRDVYNLERPHEALDLAVPASRYAPSRRAFPETLPAIEYGPTDAVRQVQADGTLSFAGHECRIGKAFAGLPVALRATTTEGQWHVYFCQQRLTTVDLRCAARTA